MKGFFKIVFASMLGVLLSFFAICLIFALIIGAALSGSENQTGTVEPNSIMHITFSEPIVERSSKNPFDKLDLAGLEASKNLGLNDILAALKRAKTDENIKGIYMEIAGVQAGMATLEEIRNALIDFKKSKKFIYAYSEVYTEDAYYLASVADKIYLNPEGILEFTGMSYQTAFFKGTLEKLEIDPQIIRVGTYKSAVEPLILDKMSEANKQQVSSFIGSIYNHFLNGISASRRIHRDSLFAIANELKVQSAAEAVTHKLADGLRYKDQVIDELKKLTKTDKKDDIKATTLSDYISGNKASSGSMENRIAMVYATGDIVSGEGDNETIGSEKIARTLRKLRTDDKVKAIVLRINSPGGSALASDVIWREVALARKEKPVIASMGDVAASGGYYIACAADSIFAEPNTITGSIGVFGVIPNMQNFFRNKLGITFDGVNTTEHADLGNINRPLTDAERLLLQKEVNRIYQTFTKRVADGRGKSQEYIDQIGQGRVWSGAESIKIGLVDRLGNIDDAIAAAAKKAKISDYRIVTYPSQKDPLGSFLSTGEDKLKEHFAKLKLGEHYQYYQQLESALRFTGIQARLPYSIAIK